MENARHIQGDAIRLLVLSVKKQKCKRTITLEKENQLTIIKIAAD